MSAVCLALWGTFQLLAITFAILRRDDIPVNWLVVGMFLSFCVALVVLRTRQGTAHGSEVPAPASPCAVAVGVALLVVLPFLML